MAEKTAYIGLGGNLGDRKGYIDKALAVLAEAEQIELGCVSDLIERLRGDLIVTNELYEIEIRHESADRIEELETALNTISTMPLKNNSWKTTMYRAVRVAREALRKGE